MNLRLTNLSLLIAILAPQLAGAVKYTITTNNTDLYEIIAPPLEKDEPVAGVYRVDAKSGKSELIFEESIEGLNRAYKGVLSLNSGSSDISSVGYDLILMANGRVVLMNMNSRPNKPDSILELGKPGSDWKVIDPLTARQVSLPVVTSREDYAVTPPRTLLLNGDRRNVYSLMFLSIKYPSPQLMSGTGITVALLTHVSGAKDTVEAHRGRSFVVAYDFMDNKKLDEMGRVFAANTSMGVIPLASEALAASLLQVENPTLIEQMWAKKLRQGYTSRETIAPSSQTILKFSSDENLAGFPLFDLAKGGYTLSHFPFETLVNEPNQFHLVEVSDPLRGRRFMLSSASNFEGKGVVDAKNSLSFLPYESQSFALNIPPIDRLKTKSGFALIPAQFSKDKIEHDKVPAVGQSAAKGFYFQSGGISYIGRPREDLNSVQAFELHFPLIPLEDTKLELIQIPKPDAASKTAIYLVSIQGKKNNPSQVVRVVLDLEKGTTEKVEIIAQRKSFYSAQELLMRSGSFHGVPVIDLVTPSVGPRAYMRASLSNPTVIDGKEVDPDKRKSTPYSLLHQPGEAGFPNDLKSRLGGSKTQAYLRDIAHQPVIGKKLVWRKFDPKSADTDLTGFWMSVKATGSDGKDTEIIGLRERGQPLAWEKKAGSTDHVVYIDDKEIRFEKGMAGLDVGRFHFYMVPFGQADPSRRGKNDGAGIKDFEMGLVFDHNANITAEDYVNTLFHKVKFPFPYRSLAFVKAIQGRKNNLGELSVLFFFKSDPKLPGSKDVVMVANMSLQKARHTNQSPWVSEPKLIALHPGFVDPKHYQDHLYIDPEGAYYWVKNPSVSLNSNQVEVMRLFQTSAQMQKLAYSNPVVRSLRSASDIDADKIGVPLGSLNRGGKWEVRYESYLLNAVPDLEKKLELKRPTKDAASLQDEDQAVSDAAKKSSSAASKKTVKQADQSEAHLLDAFSKYLETLPGQKTKAGVEVILVEPGLEEKFRLHFFRHALTSANKFSVRSSKMSFHYADQTLDDREIATEMRVIRERNIADKADTNILVVDPSLLTFFPKMQPQDEEGVSKDPAGFDMPYDDLSQQVTVTFADEKSEDPSHFLALLASGGMARTLDGVNKIKGPLEAPRSIVITNPSRWREIQTTQGLSPKLTDNIQVNSEFLTSAWTLWPPESEKATEEMKALAKSIYHPEEMKVFPTLNQVLEEAASGDSKGKQRLLIVPEELLQIIQKIILLRWSSRSSIAGDEWNFANSQLALHQLRYETDLTQAVMRDNFRSVVGKAQNKRSVLIADLETIERIGRPMNQGGKLTLISDPMRTKEEGLISSMDSSEISNADPIRFSDTDRRTIRLSLANVVEEIDRIEGRLTNPGVEETDADRLQARLTGLYEERDELRMSLDMAGGDELSEDDQDSDQAQDTTGQIVPHALYWIAGEGRILRPKARQDWSVKGALNRQVSTILVGTEEQLGRIEAQMAPEKPFFDIRDHFEVIRLQAPSLETRTGLVRSLLGKRELVSYGFQFGVRGQIGDKHQSEVINHFVNRVEQIAYDLRIEPTTAFVKAFVALRNFLSEDLDLRMSKVINENVIERSLHRVFPLSIDPDILSENDPLRSLQDIEKTVRDMQEAGYEGPADLKRHLIENYLSQTRAVDSSRPIPNSMIIYGETSTGKTFLVKTLWKVMGLVEYSPLKANNELAEAYLVNCLNITEHETNELNKYSVEKVIEFINDLLSQPKGHRAHISFDDFHKIQSVEVRKRLFQFIQGLFEAPQGMITVRSRDGKRLREIPVQNLNITMTLNPQGNEKIRSRYFKPGATYTPAQLLKRDVLAAIGTDGFEAEESVLARWSDILNLDDFPRSAKVPELAKKVREASRIGSNIVLVDPRVIDRLVDYFSSANARELLSPATSALTTIPSTAEKVPLYIVSPIDVKADSDKATLQPFTSQVSGTVLKEVVADNTKVTAVKLDDIGSLFKFMGYISREFRTQTVAALVLQAVMEDDLKLSAPGISTVLQNNFVVSMAAHIAEQSAIPVGQLIVDPLHLHFLSRAQSDHFREVLSTQFKESMGFFPLDPLRAEADQALSLDSFMSGSTSFGQGDQQTRMRVLAKYTQKIKSELESLLTLYLRLQDPVQLTRMSRYAESDVAQWFNKLPDQAPERQAKMIYDRLIRLFREFAVDFNSMDVVGQRDQASLYDLGRLYGLMMDRAIIELPWAPTAKFLLSVTDLSRDYTFGSKPQYREYMGAHPLSFFAITTSAFLSDVADTKLKKMGQSKADLESMGKGFRSVCDALLTRRTNP